MKILNSDNYINEKLNIRPVTKTRLSKLREHTVVATDKTIRDLVRAAIDVYGNDADLNFILTHKVTDMNCLFMNTMFNGDISKWDVSNVESMNSMFVNSYFDGDISKWDSNRS